DQRGGNRVAAWRERRPLSWSPLELVRSLVRRLCNRLLGLTLPIESVGQRDGTEITLVAVGNDRWIDIENHGHLTRLARFQTLLGKAETIDLVEIATNGRRRDIICSLARDLARGLVDNLVVHGRHLADADLDFVLLGVESPRQTRGHVRIKADGQRAA